MYRNYIFDLYGTLTDIRTDENKPYLWDKMVELFGFYGAAYDSGELKKSYWDCFHEAEDKARKTDEFAEIEPDCIFRKLLSNKGIENADQFVVDSLEMFMRVLSTDFIHLYDGVIELLETLKENGKKIYLLSNALSGFTKPEIRYLGIEKYFDGILISSEEGFKKPGEKFFRRLTEKYGVDFKESIMIGNDPDSDIAGANNVGMDSLFIHTAISPEYTGKVKSTYTVSDGDFRKIKALIL